MADPAELNTNEKQATPHADLIAQIMDSRVAKNEREWAAAREIERLTEALKAENAKTGISDEDMERFRRLGIWMAGYGYNWEQIFRVTRATLTPQHSPEDAAVLDELEEAHYAYNEANGTEPEYRRARAAVLARMAGKVPDGWRLVPVEPTEAMFNAVIDLGGRASFEDEYKAAIAAAPEAPR